MSDFGKFAAGVGVTGLVITAAEVGDWLTVLERIASSPVSPFLMGALTLVAFLYVLHQQRALTARCMAENDQLESVVQRIYALLATDDRFPDLPPYDDVRAGKFSLPELHRQRAAAAPSFTRVP